MVFVSFFIPSRLLGFVAVAFVDFGFFVFVLSIFLWMLQPSCEQRVYTSIRTNKTTNMYNEHMSEKDEIQQ